MIFEENMRRMFVCEGRKKNLTPARSWEERVPHFIDRMQFTQVLSQVKTCCPSIEVVVLIDAGRA